MPKIVRVQDMIEHYQEIIERLCRPRTAPERQIERARKVQWSSDCQRVRRMGLRRLVILENLGPSSTFRHSDCHQ